MFAYLFYVISAAVSGSARALVNVSIAIPTTEVLVGPGLAVAKGARLPVVVLTETFYPSPKLFTPPTIAVLHILPYRCEKSFFKIKNQK